MTQTRNEAYMKAFTPEQLDYFYGFPLWAVLMWGLGTWGSVLGSLALLLRRGLAFHCFAASLAGMVLTTVYSYLLSDGMKIMGGSVGMVIFSAVIFVIGVLLLAYARTMRARGLLR